MNGPPESSQLPLAPQEILGIFSGFEAYLDVAEEKTYDEIFQNSLIVTDANLLLDLYRYASQTRADFLAVLKRVQNNLWVPNQALVEFWRNRDSVMRDRQASPDGIREAAGVAQESVLVEFRKWTNRVFLDSEQAANIATVLEQSLADFVAKVNDLDREKNSIPRDTHQDPILKELAELLVGKVGKPFPDDEAEFARKEGVRRVDAKIPPGYKDAKKDSGHAVGDYLIWAQLLQEAAERSKDVLFITGDSKEDWWRIDGGKTKGPRPELYGEFKLRTGKTLYMLRPEGFLYHARRAVAVNVKASSIKDVERIAEASTERGRADTLASLPRLRKTEALTKSRYTAYLGSHGFLLTVIESGIGESLRRHYLAISPTGAQFYLHFLSGSVGAVADSYLEIAEALKAAVPASRDRAKILPVAIFSRHPSRTDLSTSDRADFLPLVWSAIDGWYGTDAAVRLGLCDFSEKGQPTLLELSGDTLDLG